MLKTLTLTEKLNAKEVNTALGRSPNDLQELSLIGANLSDQGLENLGQCIQRNTQLTVFSLSGTTLLAPRLNPLLERLKTHFCLKTVYLRNCLITEASREQVLKLISEMPNLSYLDISGHRLSIKDVKDDIYQAILNSQSLTKIEGINTLPQEVQLHLEQNKLFCQLQCFLEKWSSQAALEPIEAYKTQFYKTVKAIQARPHSAARLNELLVKFNAFLAKCYHLLGNIELAKEHYSRCLGVKLDKSEECEFHLTIGEILYNEGGLLTKNKTPGSPVRRKGDRQLLEAYEHFAAAKQSTSTVEIAARMHQYCGKLLGQELIALGTELLGTSGDVKYSSLK